MAGRGKADADRKRENVSVTPENYSNAQAGLPASGKSGTEAVYPEGVISALR